MNFNFTELYDQYFDDVYRYVYYRLGNKWDTEDAVSEIFRKAFQRYTSLRNDSNVKGWLLTIAHHTVIDFYRKRKNKLVPTDEMHDLAEPGAFEERFAPDDDLECLRQSLSRLSDEDRDMVSLKYLAGMKYREIGEVLGKSEEAVKTRVFRSLKKMKIWIANCLEGAAKYG